jgi:hypothetical protein
MNAPTNDATPLSRLKELQAIPDNQKTEEQWDEIIELEIALAQGGRILNTAPKQQKHHMKGPSQANGGGNPNKPQGGTGQPKKHPRRFHKKPPKPAAT